MTALIVVSEAVSNVKHRSSIDFYFVLSVWLEVSMIDDLNLPTGDHCFSQDIKVHIVEKHLNFLENMLDF